MKNTAEELFRHWAAGEGWRITKRGWPDFICRRGGELMAVEVKCGDWLSREQRETVTDLATVGLPTYIWTEEGGLQAAVPTAALADAEGISLAQLAERLRVQLEESRLEIQVLRHRLLEQRQGSGRRAAERRQASLELEQERDRLRDDLGYLLRNASPAYESHRVRALRRRYKDLLLELPEELLAAEQ